MNAPGALVVPGEVVGNHFNYLHVVKVKHNVENKNCFDSLQ